MHQLMAVYSPAQHEAKYPAEAGRSPVALACCQSRKLHARKKISARCRSFPSCGQSIRFRTNLGFQGTREAAVPALNAKLSEYQAAVGLAALDEWPAVRREWFALAEAYREVFQQSNGVRFQDGFGESWVTSTCVVTLTDARLVEMENVLTRAGVDTRLWWGDGAHHHRATAAFPRTDLPTTRVLAQSTLALPFFRDLEVDQIRLIAHAMRELADV